MAVPGARSCRRGLPPPGSLGIAEHIHEAWREAVPGARSSRRGLPLPCGCLDWHYLHGCGVLLELHGDAPAHWAFLIDPAWSHLLPDVLSKQILLLEGQVQGGENLEGGFFADRPFLPGFGLEACVLSERGLALEFEIVASRLLAWTFPGAMLAPSLAVAVGIPGLEEPVGLQTGGSGTRDACERSLILC